jgi:hypothetical protein
MEMLRGEGRHWVPQVLKGDLCQGSTSSTLPVRIRSVVPRLSRHSSYWFGYTDYLSSSHSTPCSALFPFLYLPAPIPVVTLILLHVRRSAYHSYWTSTCIYTLHSWVYSPTLISLEYWHSLHRSPSLSHPDPSQSHKVGIAFFTGIPDES